VIQYISLRLLNALPVLLVISFVVFLITFLLPGDPATVILGQNASPANVAEVRHRLGLDEPFFIRYLIWLSHLGSGDLGQSFISRQPVRTLIARALPVSLELTALSLLVALAIAIPAGIISALKKDSWVDSILSAASFSGLAMPGFWLGLMLIYLFAVNLQVLPPSGYLPLSDGIWPNLQHMFMPTFTLGVFLAAPLTRYMRAGVLGALNEDHILLAYMKGLSHNQVVLRHVVRNALIPFVTVLGIQFGYLIGGAIVIEQIFALPGMGRLGLQAVFDRDYSVLQGVAITIAGAFVAVNLIVDLIYGLLDPRIRLSTRST
jgi:peptide/nickel transport system permease protein